VNIKVQKKWIEDETGIFDEIKMAVAAIAYAQGKVTVEDVRKHLKIPLASLTEFMTRPSMKEKFITRFDKKGKRQIIGIVKRNTIDATIFAIGTMFKKKNNDLPKISIESNPLEMLWPKGLYYEILYHSVKRGKIRSIISVEQLQEEFETI
jgi:hypothetical protein